MGNLNFHIFMIIHIKDYIEQLLVWELTRTIN
ncbi:Uncharacterised protein [Mycobacteroides abscessus subsp. massiliense]|nr:Uncharacterised protein [Mycobacteroides abscessus subsp. massiliense]